MSIRLKLIGIVIPIVLVLIVSFFALAKNVVTKLSKEKLQAEAKVYTQEINNWTTKIFAELQVYQDSIEDGGFEDDDAILKYMETSLEKNESYPYGLYMGDDTGVYLDGSGWVPEDDWVLTERDWYVDGKDNDTFVFGEPYYDSMTGQVCVSASVRVDYPNAVRVLASDVYLDIVAEQISEISDNEEEDAFLVTKDSQTIIAHLDQDMLAVTLDEAKDPLYTSIGEAIAAEKSGIISVKGKNGIYFVSLNPVEHTDWYLVTYVKEQTVLADLQQMEFIMALIAVIAAAILIVVILRMMNRIVKPVKKMTDVIEKIADGDFSHNIEAKGNDEIAKMSNDMQLFIVNMRETISEIRDIAGWLEQQSQENGDISESLKTSSENQKDEMENLRKMVEQLSNSAKEATTQMDSLAELIQMADTEGKNAEVLMQESVVMSKNGKDDMEQINTGMTNVYTSISILSEQIGKVDESISQIGNMVNMIVDIAEETNLLSLNASIEAARAGSSGKGFSVVAEQIGKLAVDSSAAAEQISKLTEEIHETVEKALVHMNASVNEVQENVGVVSNASAAFEGLYEKVEETSQRVKQMIELVNKVDSVSVHMEQISQDQLQSTEHIAQSADGLNQQTKNVTQDSYAVAKEAEKLETESKELMKRISKFQV